MILCLGSLADDTFRYTLRALQRSTITFDVIDFGQFVCSGELHIPLDQISDSVLSLHGKRYSLSAYKVAFVRLIDISAAAPNEDLRNRAVGIYLSLSRLFSHLDFPVVNPPFGEPSNFSKLHHAVALSRVTGWSIPRSCLTNDPSRALAFISTCKSGVIFKGASAMKTWACVYEQELHLDRLQFLTASPVLFQERVIGADIRVHVIGNRTFTELIDSPSIDYRMAHGNAYRHVKLPDAIQKGCIQLAQECRVPFLGIDFKVDSQSGNWFFLEANSMPSYEGYDARADGAISAAIVDWLAIHLRLGCKLERQPS